MVAEREDEVNRYKLYQVDSFYVEVEWHKEYNVRRAFYSFASTNAEKLKPYLDKIDVKTVIEAFNKFMVGTFYLKSDQTKKLVQSRMACRTNWNISYWRYKIPKYLYREEYFLRFVFRKHQEKAFRLSIPITSCILPQLLSLTKPFHPFLFR